MQLAALHERRIAYSAARSAVAAAERIVIVVDDGLATGATMRAALRGVRTMKPHKLICAVPVGSGEALAAVGQIADEVVCLRTPSWFGAISQCYTEFPRVEDGEVMAILKQCALAARAHV